MTYRPISERIRKLASDLRDQPALSSRVAISLDEIAAKVAELERQLYIEQHTGRA